MIEKPNSLFSPERHESEPEGRDIDVYVYRHAEAEDASADPEITKLGRAQAKKAGESLLEQIRSEGGGVIKILSSPALRAEQTAETMRAKMEEIIDEEELGEVKLMETRSRQALRPGGVIGELRKQGIDDPIEHWLNNPESVEGTSPADAAEQFTEVLVKVKSLADRLPPGEKINYVIVSHEVPAAAVLNQATGKTLQEMGGDIKNCESFKVEIRGNLDESSNISFRDVEAKIDLRKQ